jgi:AcrR family transcriptional regulator
VSPSTESRRRLRLGTDERQQHIVLAAQSLFSQRPYDAVSTGEIAAAAGTTRTNLLYHFNTKRDLFLEIVGPFTRIPEEVAPAAQSNSIEDRVSSILLHWLKAVERNRDTFMTILNAASSTDPQVSAVLQDSMRTWERRLLRIIGMDPSDPSHQAMMQSFQAMVAASSSAWLSDGTLTRADVHSMLTACLVALGESQKTHS